MAPSTIARVFSEIEFLDHQGLDNRLILPDESHAANRGRLQCRERLGGMLNYYYRAAA
jgi:hypothetical protein